MAAITPTVITRSFKRVMRRTDLILFTVCAILVIDQLAASAALGAPAIFWWIFTLVFFFIPYGLISSELGTAYPEERGDLRLGTARLRTPLGRTRVLALLGQRGALDAIGVRAFRGHARSCCFTPTWDYGPKYSSASA